jgi:hypothetical protein
MRRYNVFGKKLSKTKALPFMILIFVAVVAGYYLISAYQTQRLETLEQRELELNLQISQLINDQENETYLEIGELMPYLPSTYDKQSIDNEMLIAKNIALFEVTDTFTHVINDDVSSPFDETLDESVTFVRVTVSFTVDDHMKALSFMESIIDMTTIYYIDSMDLSFLTNGNVQVDMVIFTFYNDIN